MTSDGTHSYTWDARNRLSLIDSGNTASFSYDAFDRRTSKTILGTQIAFLYDRANPVQELSGTTASANLLTGGLDEYFQRTDSAGTRAFLTDALGSTLALTDSTGTIQTSYTFDPFGGTAVSGSTTSNSYAYAGREMDGTGLYFNRARYYAPSISRFISEDPVRLWGGFDFLVYAENNPISNRDPLGTWPGPVCWYYGGKCTSTGLQCQQDLDIAAGKNDPRTDPNRNICEGTHSADADTGRYKRSWDGNYYCQQAFLHCGQGVLPPNGGDPGSPH